MVHLHHNESMQMQGMRRRSVLGEQQVKRHKFFINDNIDILREILKRLDGPSLGVAACVCRLWCSLTRNDDSLWEHLCFRHVSTPPPASIKPVVVALGGYKRLYMVCVRPVLSRLGDSERVRKRVWTRHEVQLSLSLFCIESYERLASGRLTSDASASSLMFLCNPINV
ncbi:F-box-like domain superfamily [Sesbania bispinosa]|nr:F-box-like domain superfamily [Sesbania bispinosa]